MIAFTVTERALESVQLASCLSSSIAELWDHRRASLAGRGLKEALWGEVVWLRVREPGLEMARPDSVRLGSDTFLLTGDRWKTSGSGTYAASRSVLSPVLVLNPLLDAGTSKLRTDASMGGVFSRVKPL